MRGEGATKPVEQPLAATESTTECIAFPWMPAPRGACPKGASSASPGLSRHRRGYPGRDGPPPANPIGVASVGGRIGCRQGLRGTDDMQGIGWARRNPVGVGDRGAFQSQGSGVLAATLGYGIQSRWDCGAGSRARGAAGGVATKSPENPLAATQSKLGRRLSSASFCRGFQHVAAFRTGESCTENRKWRDSNTK